MKNRFRLQVMALAMAALSFQSCSVLKELGLVPSEFEMAMGLKSALEQGLFRGFQAFKDPSVNPLLAFAFPGDAQKIVATLQNLGLGNVVNQTTGKINKALADAVNTAQPIFLDALKRMSIADAARILITDNPHAATQYFKTNTKNELIAAMRPIADSNVRAEGLDRDWGRITTVVNNLPFVNVKLENSLGDFLAARAVDGMYLLVAEEEEKIRKDLNFRKTDIVKKVFGYADQELKKRGMTGGL